MKIFSFSYLKYFMKTEDPAEKLSKKMGDCVKNPRLKL